MVKTGHANAAREGTMTITLKDPRWWVRRYLRERLEKPEAATITVDAVSEEEDPLCAAIEFVEAEIRVDGGGPRLYRALAALYRVLSRRPGVTP